MRLPDTLFLQDDHLVLKRKDVLELSRDGEVFEGPERRPRRLMTTSHVVNATMSNLLSPSSGSQT